MITRKRLLLLTLVLQLITVHIFAQENVQSQPAPKYRMDLVYIFEADRVEHIFVIGPVGFKSIDSLKRHLSKLPSGSVLEWAPSCKRMGNEPLLESEEEMEEFKAFCVERGIKFILVPSG